MLAAFFWEFLDAFAKDKFDLGDFNRIEHKIDTGNHTLIKQRMNRTPPRPIIVPMKKKLI